MAYGVLKKRYLSELRQAPPPRSYEERAAARASEDQLIGVPLHLVYTKVNFITRSSRMSCAPRALLALCAMQLRGSIRLCPMLLC